MKRLVLLFSLIVGGLAAGIAYAWTAQNASVTARLALDLGARVGAWEMAEPAPVTMLMGLSFGSGFFFAALIFGLWGLANRLRADRSAQADLLGLP